MTFIRKKIIKGNTYFYEVESIREGDKVRQKVIKYLGKEVKQENKELGTTIKGRGISIDEFQPFLIDAIDKVAPQEMAGGIVSLPALKAELDNRIELDQESFKDYLIRSEKKNTIFLTVANDPFALKPERKKFGFDLANRGFIFFAQLR